MSDRAKNWVRVATRIGTIIGLLILAWQIGLAADESLRSEPDSFRALPLLAAGMLGLVGYFLQMTSWHLLVRSSGRRVPFVGTLADYPRSFVARYVPGAIWGYLSRVAWLRSSQGLASKTTWGLSIAEAIGLVGTCAVVPLRYLPSRANLMPPIVAHALSIVYLVLLVSAVPLAASRTRMGRSVFPGGLSLRTWLPVVSIDLLYWACFGWGLLGVRIGIGAPVSLDWLAAMGATGVAVLAGFAVLPIPGGLGVREATLAILASSDPALAVHNPSLMGIVFRMTWAIPELAWLALGSILATLTRPTEPHARQ